MPHAKELLIKGEPNADESFGGYILRLTQWNYYDTPSQILNGAGFAPIYLHVGCSFLFSESVEFTRLAQFAGVDPVKLVNLTYPPAVTFSSPTQLIFGQPIPKNLIRLRSAKVCSLCLRESNYCQRVWDLAAITACPIHRIILIDECPSCGKRITWVRNKISICRCEFDWREAPVHPVEEPGIRIAQQIYQQLGLATENKDESSNTLSSSPLSTLDLMHFLIAIGVVA